MKKMHLSPYERVFCAINNKEFDVFPAINPTSVATVASMGFAKAHFPVAHTDPIKMADLASVGYSHFGFDSIAPYFSIHLESAALGATVNWQDANKKPTITHTPIKDVDSFSVPNNFFRSGYFQNLLKAITILKKQHNKAVPIIGKVMGPWTLAYNLYGVDNLTIDIILEPQRVAYLLKELYQVSITFAKAQFEAGADIVTWADHATADIVSAQIYEEFVLPYHKQGAATLKKYGPAILHICGNVMDRTDIIAQSGFPIFHMDSRNDVVKAQDTFGGRMQITGTINNPATLAHGTPQAVEKEVLINLKKGIKLISPECALPYTVPKENLLALVKTAHRYNVIDIQKKSVGLY